MKQLSSAIRYLWSHSRPHKKLLIYTGLGLFWTQFFPSQFTALAVPGLDKVTAPVFGALCYWLLNITVSPTMPTAGGTAALFFVCYWLSVVATAILLLVKVGIASWQNIDKPLIIE